MCIQGPQPQIPDQPAAIENPSRLVDPNVTAARADTQRQARQRAGARSTVRTSEAVRSTGRTLLGET